MPTLILEDGTGIDSANSYQSYSDIETYLSDRGNTSFAALTQAQKETAAITAADHINARWGARVKGIRLSTTQGLLFPRDGVVDSDGVELTGNPADLLKAHAEYALVSSGLPIVNNPTAPVDSAGAYTEQGPIKKKMEKVGPITESIEYAGSGQNPYMPSVPRADAWMRELVRSGNRVIR